MDLKELFRKHISIIVAFTCVHILVLNTIIRGTGIPQWRDLNAPILGMQLVHEFIRVLNSWDPYTITGNIQVHYPFLNSLFVFIYSILHNISLTYKSIIILIFLLMSFAMYTFSTHILRLDRFSAFLSGMVYTYNPWIFDRLLAGHLNILLGVAFIPMILIFENRIIRAKNIREILIYSFLISLCLSSTLERIHIFLITIFIMFLYIFVYIHKNNIKNIVIGSTIVSLMFLLLNSWYLIKLFIASSTIIATHFPTIEELIGYCRAATYLNAFAGSTYPVQFFYNNTGVWFKIAFIIFSAIVLSSIVLLRNIIYRYKRVIVISYIMFFLGIFLSLGYNSPGKIFVYLYDNLRIFSLFREPSKFNIFIVFSVTILFSLVLSKMLSNFKEQACTNNVKNYIKRSKNVIALFLIGMVIFNAISWGFALQQAKNSNQIMFVKYPKRYTLLTRWWAKVSRNNDFRVSILPPDPEIKYDFLPQKVTDPLVVFPITPVVNLRDIYYITPDSLYSWTVFRLFYYNNTKYIAYLLGLMSVKYFIIRNDAHPRMYGGGPTRFSDKLISNKTMTKQDSVKYVMRFGNKIFIYKNYVSLPHIFKANYISLGVGNRLLINSLMYLDPNIIIDYPMVFIYDINSINQFKTVLKYTKYIFIQDNKWKDMIFQFINKKYIINLNKYVPRTQNMHRWVSSDFRITVPFLTKEIGNFIFTFGNSRISIPYTINRNNYYDIWVRVYTTRHPHNLIFLIENSNGKVIFRENLCNIIKAFPYVNSFYWIYIKSLFLSSGRYKIILKSNGFNAVSYIAIVPKLNLEQIKNTILKMIKRYNIKIVNIIEAEDINNVDKGWVAHTGINASNGYILSASKSTISIPIRILNNMSKYILAIRVLLIDHASNLRIIVNDNKAMSLRLYNLHPDRRFAWIYLLLNSSTLKNDSIKLKIEGGVNALIDLIVIMPYNSLRISNVKSLQFNKLKISHIESPIKIIKFSINNSTLSITTMNKYSVGGFVLLTSNRRITLDTISVLVNASVKSNTEYNPLNISGSLMLVWKSRNNLYAVNVLPNTNIPFIVQGFVPKGKMYNFYMVIRGQILNVSNKYILHSKLYDISFPNITLNYYNINEFNEKENLNTNYTRVNAEEYIINDCHPRILVFLESFSKDWILKSLHIRYLHLKAYDFANLYIILNNQLNNKSNTYIELLYRLNSIVSPLFMMCLIILLVMIAVCTFMVFSSKIKLLRKI